MPKDNASPQNPDAEDRQAVDISRIEKLLVKGHITDIHNAILWGSNYAKLVSVEDETLQTTAVYKPQRGERPLWDFPDGTLCFRETASYLVSKALGWHLVPPTVLPLMAWVRFNCSFAITPKSPISRSTNVLTHSFSAIRSSISS
jgi:hypothetical protein